MTSNTRNLKTAGELVEFVRNQTANRGWGRGLRTAVAEWYLRQPVSKLAREVLPDLAEHRFIIRRAHPKPRTLEHNAFFQWVTTGELGHLATPELRAGALSVLAAVERLNVVEDLHEAVRLVEENRLPPELVPPRFKRTARIWEALLDHSPVPSLLSHLGSMAEAGLFANPELTAVVVARLSNRHRLASISKPAIEAALREYRQIAASHAAVEQVLAAALTAAAAA